MVCKITTYSGVENAPEYTNVSLKTVLAKTEFSLPPPFNKKSSIKEAEILKEVLRKLEYNRIFHVRLSLGGVIRNTKAGAILTANPMSGWCDILCLRQGNLIALELKRTGGSVTSKQLSVMKEINANGGKAYILTSATNLGKCFTNEISNYWCEGIQVW